ncbi:MAG TPA: hypothetical protein VJU77_02535 [Chthoniobacterales bacterium]|nr:hypothetical protein [Chthoniobacterales bacterium]
MKNRTTVPTFLRNQLSKPSRSLFNPWKTLWLCASLLSGLTICSVAKAGDLTPDPNFRAPSFASIQLPERALLLPDGKYLLYFDPDTLTDRRTAAVTRFLPDGTLDTTFNFDRSYKLVRAAASAGGGKIYISATRYVYAAPGKDVEYILRLNNDGSIDPTFNPANVGGSNTSTFAWNIYVQPDAKILVIGYFTTIAGIARTDVARLLPDGTVDPSFVPATVTGGDIYSLALQPDNKILIGGSFNNVNGLSNRGVARLEANGSIDSTFQPSGFSRGSSTSRIRALLVQSDGKIVMSGQFRLGTSGPRAPILRLNANGTVDSTFAFSTTSDSLIGRDLIAQPDGKLVIVASSTVLRYNPDGTGDSTFHLPTTVNTTFTPTGDPGTPVTLSPLPDGDMLLGGIFNDVDPVGASTDSHLGVARLNPDGTLDSSLTTTHKTGKETAPSSFGRLDDGSTLIGFASLIDPPIPYNVGRLLADGSLDPNFTLSSPNQNSFLSGGFSALGFERLTDGSFLVFGFNANFSFTYGKVLPTGIEDTTYSAESTAFQSAIALPQGKVFVSCASDPQTTLYSILARLQANGHFDGTFHLAESISSSQVIRLLDGQLDAIYAGTRVLAVQSDGRILFEYLGEDESFHVVRLNADGSIDGSFAATTINPFDLSLNFPVVYDPLRNQTIQPPKGVFMASLPLLDAHVQPDGRIVLAGQFTAYNGTSARGVVRLNSDGTVDGTFNSGGGAQWTQTPETSAFFPRVENIELQPDGKFLVSGTFEAFDGVAAPGIASLNPDGSVDPSFVAPARRDKYSRVPGALAPQPDGSFLLSGPYTFPNETLSPSFIRLVGDFTPMVANISTRLLVGTDDNVLIEGFIVQGPAGSSKKLLVRAIGPSLAQFGVPDALANPTLEIHDASGTTVATNNDWKTTQIGGLITGNQFTEINGSGLAPTDDLESAIIANLEPGSYTAVVRGAGNTVGTGVVDAFDLSSASPARLANIATRGLVQPGDGLMIAGFIVQNGPIQAVVRALGPSLLDFGIPNALTDTTLQLRDQQGALVLENDDWRSSQEQELINLGLQPSHDLEAALVATIQPGQYTAQVRGKGNAAGIGVVQVYFVQ